MGLISAIKRGVSKVAHAIGHAFHSATSAISSTAHAVGTKIGSAVSTIHDDVKGAVQTAYKTASNIASGVKGTVDNVINKTTGVLSMPLILLGGAAVVFAFNSKSNFSASYNR